MLVYKIFCWYLTLFGVQNVIEAVITTPVACSLNLSHSSLSKQIEERIEDKGSLRLVRYHFNIKNDTGPFSTANRGESFLINPYSSVLAIDGAAKSLLHLKEYFVEMSLYTLNFSVAEYKVELDQWPTNCLVNVSATDLEIELKLLIFRNFGASRSSAITLEGEVCSQYMKVIKHTSFLSSDYTIGVPTYNCCRLDGKGQLICNDLEKSFWEDTIFAAVIILKMVFVLYSPIILPTYDRKEEKYVNYIYKPTNKHKLRVVQINTSETVSDDYFVKLFPFQSRPLSSFKTIMREQSENTLYTVDVKELHLLVKKTRIVADGEAPVTVFGFLNSYFFRCDTLNNLSEMRGGVLSKTGFSFEEDEEIDVFSRTIFKKHDLKSCCTTSACPQVYGVYKHCNNYSNHCRWYKIFSWLMKLIYISITIPWWFRLWFYYRIEEGSMAQSKHICDKNGLSQQSQGSLVLLLTPLHPFFIFIHILYLLCFLIVCIIYFRKADLWSNIILILRKSLEGTIDGKRFDLFLKVLALIFFPMKKYGILCIFLFPIWFLPLLLFGVILLAGMIFPLLNFTMRLGFNVYRLIYEHPKYAVLALFVFLWWLLIPISLIFITECLGFYAECLIYLLIGIILNSEETFNYLVLSLSIAIYAYQCFSSVGSRYQTFGKLLNKTIFKQLEPKEVKEIKQMAAEEKHKRQEHAFVVTHKEEAGCKNGIHVKLTSTNSMNSYLILNAERLLLFLDTDNKVYISREFFMKVASMDHPFCPGPVHTLYLSALIKLFWIAFYLTFQFVVIAAFGRATNSSIFTQTMATIAGGFLPYTLTTCFMKEHSQSNLKEIENNLEWEFKIKEIIENFEERWYLADLVLDHIEVTEQNANVNNKQNDIDLILKRTVKEQAYFQQFEFWCHKKSPSAVGRKKEHRVVPLPDPSI